MIARTQKNQGYYEYNPDSDSFAGVGFAMNDNDAIIEIHRHDTPLSPTWVYRSCEVFNDNHLAEGDFPSVSNYRRIPLMSERAWTALRPLIGYCCEALPIIHPSGDPYFIVHVMNTIDALDADASQVRRSDGPNSRIYRIDRYAFHNALIKHQHIFKLPLMSGAKLIVDEEFRRTVEINRLRGLLFDELPMADCRD